MCHSQQNRGCRDDVSNKTQGAICCPLGPRLPRREARVILPRQGPTYRWRIPRCGVNQDLFACAAGGDVRAVTT